MPDSAEKTRLKAMAAWTTVPELSDEEIDALLANHQITDANGVAPGGVGYVPTYNLRAAAREAWSWKLGRCSDQVSSDMDGDRMSSNQLFDHCRAMRDSFAQTGSPKIGPGFSAVTDYDCF